MPRLVPATEEEKKLREECREKTEEWINSPEFKKEMKESMEAVYKMQEHLRESVKIDYLKLLEPFTI